MSKHFKVWRLFDEELEAAAMRGELDASPLVEFAHETNEVLNGFRVICEMLQADAPSIDDDNHEGDCLISDFQRDALLGLTRITSSQMISSAERIKQLSRNRIKGA